MKSKSKIVSTPENSSDNDTNANGSVDLTILHPFVPNAFFLYALKT